MGLKQSRVLLYRFQIYTCRWLVQRFSVVVQGTHSTFFFFLSHLSEMLCSWSSLLMSGISILNQVDKIQKAKNVLCCGSPGPELITAWSKFFIFYFTTCLQCFWCSLSETSSVLLRYHDILCPIVDELSSVTLSVMKGLL